MRANEPAGDLLCLLVYWRPSKHRHLKCSSVSNYRVLINSYLSPMLASSVCSRDTSEGFIFQQGWANGLAQLLQFRLNICPFGRSPKDQICWVSAGCPPWWTPCNALSAAQFILRPVQSFAQSGRCVCWLLRRGAGKMAAASLTTDKSWAVNGFSHWQLNNKKKVTCQDQTPLSVKI